MWRALAVFNPSLWELVRLPKVTAGFHLGQLLAQPPTRRALLSPMGLLGLARACHHPRDIPGSAHCPPVPQSHRFHDPAPTQQTLGEENPSGSSGAEEDVASQEGAGCGQQSCRTFNICMPKQFKQAVEPTYLFIIV